MQPRWPLGTPARTASAEVETLCIVLNWCGWELTLLDVAMNATLCVVSARLDGVDGLWIRIGTEANRLFWIDRFRSSAGLAAFRQSRLVPKPYPEIGDVFIGRHTLPDREALSVALAAYVAGNGLYQVDPEVIRDAWEKALLQPVQFSPKLEPPKREPWVLRGTQ